MLNLLKARLQIARLDIASVTFFRLVYAVLVVREHISLCLSIRRGIAGVSLNALDGRLRKRLQMSDAWSPQGSGCEGAKHCVR